MNKALIKMELEKIHLKNGNVYDMENPSDILDYLIFITSDFNRLLNYSLYHFSDKTLLEEFYNEYQNDAIKHKYAFCHLPFNDFKDEIIDRENQFTFNSYLFDNHLSSEVEKVSKITALYTRIGKILDGISERLDLERARNLPLGKEDEFFKNIEPWIWICPNHNDEYIKIEGLFIKMVYSAAGRILSDINEKIENELSGFLNLHAITKKRITSPFLSTKKSREDIVEKLIGFNTKNYEIFQKYESKLVTYGYLSDARNEWKNSAAAFVRFYNLCEKKKIFSDFYQSSTKGICLLRELYTFDKGKDLNPPSKRRKQITPSTKGEFAFLELC